MIHCHPCGPHTEEKEVLLVWFSMSETLGSIPRSTRTLKRTRACAHMHPHLLKSRYR